MRPTMLRLYLQPPCWRCWLVAIGSTFDSVLAFFTAAMLTTNLSEIAVNFTANGDHKNWGELEDE